MVISIDTIILYMSMQILSSNLLIRSSVQTPILGLKYIRFKAARLQIHVNFHENFRNVFKSKIM
jgi:hypothetical protein